MSRRSDDIGVDDGFCLATEHDAPAAERALAGLPGQPEMKRASDIFGALGDPTRLRILAALAEVELCVCDLADVAGVSESAVSHQLRLLRNLDLVAFRRDGKRAVYRLADDHVRALLEQGLRHAGEGFAR
jgi:ArsR family transcriptional regulator